MPVNKIWKFTLRMLTFMMKLFHWNLTDFEYCNLKLINPNDTNLSTISFQVEKLHTGLALIYLESIETATGKGNENDQNGISFRREKFRQHILQSTCVQFSYLLSRLESSSAGADLHYEKAILYGKVSTCRLTYITSLYFESKVFVRCGLIF